MIVSKTTKSTAALDSLSIFGELQPIQGHTTQIFYEVSQTYEDDRRYVPLVLFGEFYVADPAGIMTGVPTFSSIEWYDDVPLPNDSVTHRISNPAASVLSNADQYRNVDYLVSDGSNAEWCAGTPRWALIVHKNVQYITAKQIYAIVKFYDSRTGTTVSKQLSIPLSTEYYADSVLTVTGSRGEEWIMDPISFPEPTTSGSNITAEAWQRIVSAQLFQKGTDVADNEASYQWLVRDDAATGGWRAFNATETNRLLISGNNTKTLTLDVRYIDRDIHLRCYAAEKESSAEWSSPFADGNPFYEVHITMEMTQKLDCHIAQTKGFGQDFDLTKTCHFDIQLKYGQKNVPTNKLGLFNITWKATNLSTSVTQTLGTGTSIEFVPSMKGFTAPDGYAVYAEAKVFKYKALSNGNNVFGTSVPVRSKAIINTIEVDALSIWGQIIVLQGQTNQNYDDATGTYEADRRYAPLILNGSFYVNDPQGKMTGTPAIRGIEWYTAAPQKTATGEDDYTTNRISNPGAATLADEDLWRNTDYLISDGSNAEWCQDVPQYALIVHKNVPYITAQTIYAVIKFVDTRTGTVVRKQCSIDLTTEFFSANTLSMDGTRGKEWIMDPLAIPEPLTAGNDVLDEPWERTISAQLRYNGRDAADAEACYLWVVRDNTTGNWREFSDIEKSVMLRSLPTVKSLVIDARFIDSINVRCYGCMRESGAAWVSPFANDKPYYECNIAVRMSKKLDVKTVQTKGFELIPSMDNTCHYDVKITYGRRTVPANKMGLFRIAWKGINNKTFSTQILNWGKSLDFVPKEKGFSYPDGFGVRAEVSTMRCMALVTSDSQYVIDGNNYVISGIYE